MNIVKLFPDEIKKAKHSCNGKQKEKEINTLFSIVIIFLNLDNEEQKVPEKPETFSETFCLW